MNVIGRVSIASVLSVALIVGAALALFLLPLVALVLSARLLRWRRNRALDQAGPGHPDRYARLSWRDRRALRGIEKATERNCPRTQFGPVAMRQAQQDDRRGEGEAP